MILKSVWNAHSFLNKKSAASNTPPNLMLQVYYSVVLTDRLIVLLYQSC